LIAEVRDMSYGECYINLHGYLKILNIFVGRTIRKHVNDLEIAVFRVIIVYEAIYQLYG
jgi:hypothetical protein